MSMALLFVIVATILTGGKLFWIYRGTRQVKDGVTLDPLSWLIWGVLSVATLLPQIKEVGGWEWAMLFGIANLVVNICALVLSIKHGIWKIGWGGALSLAAAAFGIAMWIKSGDAWYGLWFSIGADAVGAVRTWYKSYREPQHERVLTWLLGALAGLCATISAFYAGEEIVLPYPLYVVFNASVTTVIIIVRRRVPTTG